MLVKQNYYTKYMKILNKKFNTTSTSHPIGGCFITTVCFNAVK